MLLNVDEENNTTCKLFCCTVFIRDQPKITEFDRWMFVGHYTWPSYKHDSLKKVKDLYKLDVSQIVQDRTIFIPSLK